MQNLSKEIEDFRSLLQKSKNIVFFGGAGVSTASGIPDFRSPDGLYKTGKNKDKPWARHQAEELLSHSFFMSRTEWFYEYYKENILHTDAKPNACHTVLSKWEDQGKLLGVITQNIDGLHQIAGSKKVCELHGTVLKNHCMDCKKAYDLEELDLESPIPTCSCGGTIKPDVTLYEEALPDGAIEQALDWIHRADLIIIGGTSLAVYPAAGLVQYRKKDTPIVMVNLGTTSQDRLAELRIAHDIASVFSLVEDVFVEA